MTPTDLTLFQGKRVFLTGHTGFKGSWLTLWLQRLGAEVTGYALPPAYANSHFALLDLERNMHHIEGDIRNYDHLHRSIEQAKPDFVFHLAAQALVQESYRSPKETFDVNVGGSVNLLEALRTLDYQGVLLYITSDKCYRNQEWCWGYRETDAMGGKDPYSASKGAAELVFTAYERSFYRPKGSIRAASVRAGNVIGGGDWADNRIVPDCIRALIRQESIILRNPTATRPWQHVLEPLGAYLALAARLYSSSQPENLFGGWNVGPRASAHICVEELVQRIVSLWGSGEYRVELNPNAPPEDHFLFLNCDKARHYWNWEPVWDLPIGLAKTVEWYRHLDQGSPIREVSQKQIEEYSAAFCPDNVEVMS